MSNVIPLTPKPRDVASQESPEPQEPQEPQEPRIWVCECGCSTFELLENSTVRCALCEAVTPGSENGWYAYDTPRVWAGDDPIRDISGNGCEEFARRLVQSYATHPDACAVVVVCRDSTLRVWSDIETEEQKAWLGRQLGDVLELIGKKAKDG